MAIRRREGHWERMEGGSGSTVVMAMVAVERRGARRWSGVEWWVVRVWG